MSAEALIDGGALLAAERDSAARFAEALALLVRTAPDPATVSTLAPSPAWVGWDHAPEKLWPAPDDREGDLNEHPGDRWLDEIATAARGQLLALDRPAVIGHGDWYSQNLRWIDRRLHVVHDWDSAVNQAEAAIAGQAAAVWSGTGLPGEVATVAQSESDRPRLAAAVWSVAGVVVLALLLVAGRYGFHGDEFYFVVTGRHLQVAAPDNPMLVPYLAAGWYGLVSGHLWAFRVLPALAAGAYVLLGALMAREFGAAPRHQLAAAAAVAMTALTLAVGHLFETTTFDMVTTAAAVWLFVRAMRSEPQRWTPWIAAGVLTGVAMEIKVLAAPLLVCCLLGVVICGPRSRLLSPRLWTAVAIALLMAAPNLVWQAVHGIPMLKVAANIAGGGSTSSTPRVALVPSVLLAVGPVVSIVLIVGLIVLLRSDRRGTDGWLAAGFLIFLAFLLITGGKAYYPAGLVPAVLAAGAGPVLDWVFRGRLWRPVLAVGLILFTVVNTTLLTLPVGRPGGLVFTIATGPNPDLAAEAGWSGYVDQVGEVVASIPAAQRADTIVLAQSYQQAARSMCSGPRTE